MTTPSNAFIVDALMHPAAFPHAVELLALKQTHISWIVLTGPFVYKIKKAVTLSFIDASTLERRHWLCREELRLNRRLSAELYVDVVPITQDAQGVRVDGTGTPIEYAVRMKQFDPREELAELLARDAVRREELEALAVLLSEFHARAPRWEPDTASGPPQRLFDAVHANLRELEAASNLDPGSDDLASSAAWLRSRMVTEHSRFEARRDTGWVRECHGDLHAGNIVRHGGRLLPFDCLEFDPTLRWIDVLDEVAFLFMDLTSRSRRDLACAFLNRYLEATGDYSGVSLLPFFATHRALVRAKVAWLSNAEERGQHYLRQAREWTCARAQALILMHGVSGSGKSWLSERLISALPAIRIRSDVERKRLAGMTADQRAAAPVDAGLYSRAFTRRTYEHLARCAASCLKGAMTIIVDATFLDADMRARFRDLAHELQVPLFILACEARREELAERIRMRARRGDRTSDADVAVLEAQLRTLQPFNAEERDAVIRVSTDDADVVERALAALRERLTSE